ncbi:YggS family pyridoxal phosphate-dependent enzyme [Parasediminibacterium paludis]|uniref:Pyridoxal phosphate homeostasis protein n=1 Tax=Parasediminibacterium paludis TaxID=908966 RepID=A0ABV8PZR6_9BACT
MASELEKVYGPTFDKYLNVNEFLEMAINTTVYQSIIEDLKSSNTTLVAVSKTKPISDIEALYKLGQRDFGENYVQEFIDKVPQLPQDIKWHFIGHLQTNKVKYIVPYVHLIHGVDSLKLLKEIDKQASKNNLIINCLLQVYIAQEDTKFGLDAADIEAIINELPKLNHIKIVGLMGMASFSEDKNKVAAEFKYLKSIYDRYSQLKAPNFQLQNLSMGMSGDYKLAVEAGSNMVRIGSLLFGARI